MMTGLIPSHASGQAARRVRRSVVALGALSALAVVVSASSASMPAGAASGAKTGAAQFSIKVIRFPANTVKGTNPSITVRVKNLTQTAVKFADITSNKFGFELWQWWKGTTWTLDARSVPYFRGLPAARELQANNFGVIKPGTTGDVTLSVRPEFSVDTAAPEPQSPWKVIGRDSNGAYYLQTNTKALGCGVGTFEIDFGKVTNLHSNPDGHVVADLLNSAVSNHFKMNTTATNTFPPC